MNKTKPSIKRFPSVRLGIAASFLIFGLSQAQISGQEKTMTIESAFKTIELKTGYSIFYKKELINADTKIDLENQDDNIQTYLAELTRKTGLKFTTVGKQIIVSEITPIMVSGKISEPGNASSANTNIKNLNSGSSTVTDDFGNFALAAKIGDVLQVSNGTLSEKVTVEGNTLNFSLQPLLTDAEK